MQINDIDILTYSATLLSKDIQTAKVTTYNDWLRNSNKPIDLGKIEEKYIPIKLRFCVKGEDETSALKNKSDLIKQCEKAKIVFDDINYTYQCCVVSHSCEMILPCKYTVEVELKGYAYGLEVSVNANRTASKSITNVGNTITPCIVEVTPTTNLDSIAIGGLSNDSIVINNLTADTKVTIDGEVSTVMEGTTNKYGDTDMWEFPRLKPGDNTVTFDDSTCNITIKYKPRYM